MRRNTMFGIIACLMSLSAFPGVAKAAPVLDAEYVGPTWVAWRIQVLAGQPVVLVKAHSTGGGCQPGVYEVIRSDGTLLAALEGTCDVPVSVSDGSLSFRGLSSAPCCGGGPLTPGQYWIVVALNANSDSIGDIRLEITTDGNSPVTSSNDASSQVAIEGFATGRNVAAYTDYDFAKAGGGEYLTAPGYTRAHVHGTLTFDAQHLMIGWFGTSNWDKGTRISYTTPGGRTFSAPGMFVGEETGYLLGSDGLGTYTFRLDEDFEVAGQVVPPTELALMDVTLP